MDKPCFQAILKDSQPFPAISKTFQPDIAKQKV